MGTQVTGSIIYILVSGGEEEKSVPVRETLGMGRGLNSGLGRIDATGLLSYIFFVSFPFLFLISYLFHNFCTLDLNQFKPLSKFFEKSTQCFKIVRNMFSKIKGEFQQNFMGLAACLHNQNRNRVLK
jgi:hypothetical protein